MQNMRIINAITFAFTNHKVRIKTILYAIGLFLVFGIATSLVPNAIFKRMMIPNIFDYLFLFTTAILSAVFISLPEKKVCAVNSSGFGGTFLGVLAFACPTCNALLVYLLGMNLLIGIFDPLRPVIGLISIIILLYVIDKKWQYIK